MQGIRIPIMFVQKPVNRDQRRKMDFEFERNSRNIYEIEGFMLEEIFEDVDYDSAEYDKMYKFYKSQFDEECSRLDKGRLLKYTVLYPKYFEFMFSPVAKDGGINIYKPIRELFKKLAA